jgi:hypothetical protein
MTATHFGERRGFVTSIHWQKYRECRQLRLRVNRIPKSNIDLQRNLRPGELSTEPDMNTVVLIILFDRRSFDRLAIKENTVVFRDFADGTEDLLYVSDGRVSPAKQVTVFRGRWVSPVHSVKSVAPGTEKGV